MADEASANRLTPQAYKLLGVLEKRRNQWLTRLEIARGTGKKRLTPYDIDLLARLAENGRIRAQQDAGYSREGYRWLYGVFDDEMKAD